MNMRTKQTGLDAVREIALGLPRVEAGTTYGSPAFKVDGKMFTCVAVHRSAEPDTLVVRMDFDERDGLIAAEPKTYYLTDHYVDYPCVLVRLTRVRHDALPGLAVDGLALRLGGEESNRCETETPVTARSPFFLWYSRSAFAREFDAAEFDAAFVSGRGLTSKWEVVIAWTTVRLSWTPSCRFVCETSRATWRGNPAFSA